MSEVQDTCDALSSVKYDRVDWSELIVSSEIKSIIDKIHAEVQNRSNMKSRFPIEAVLDKLEIEERRLHTVVAAGGSLKAEEKSASFVEKILGDAKILCK